ncbi:MAG TPA: aspartate kinase [Candidatus Acidoferrum sp.]|nr:aspartate kinase [Candidatus Acidoferrum sp.]
MTKVVKFGGSSLAEAAQFKKVKQIIESDPARRYVVVSAAGKRRKDDNKITDLLYLCHAHIQYSVSCESVFGMVEERYREIRDELGLTFDLEREFAEIRRNMVKGMPADYLVSRGEYLTARLMAEYLGYRFVDAKDVIHFQFDGKLDMDKSARAFKAAAGPDERLVIPGFYGAMPGGEIRVLSRGGSDITGSIVAAIVGADLYENWTDVSGILMADPRIIDNPLRIDRITYSELHELAYMGANVLHEGAIYPVRERGIPIHILNTNDPVSPGTLIVESCEGEADGAPITGIAGRKDFTVVTIYKNQRGGELGIIRRALEVFEKYSVKVEHIPSGIESFSVVVATEQVQSCIYDIAAEIKAVCDPSDIRIINGISLIATVGRNMVYKPGMSGRLFAALGAEGVNIRMIAQGSDEINIIVGVENKDFETTVRAIYKTFIGGKE